MTASSSRAVSEELVETDLAVLGGNPSAQELAALTAVLAGVLDELAAEQGRRQSSVQSAWARSQRGINGPVQPGPGAWRSFNG